MNKYHTVRLYVDVYEHMDINWITATSRPGKKTDNVTRLAFDIQIEEKYIFPDYDEKLEVPILHEVKDDESP